MSPIMAANTAQFSNSGPTRSSTSSSSNTTAAANFVFSPAASSSNIFEESHHANNGCEVEDSHFSDIAQAAASAMENIDMDNLCSELFSQEMLTQGVLEEAVGVSPLEIATMLATVTPTNTATTGHVTDCSICSTDGGEVAVPSTIDVPSKFPAKQLLMAPRPSAAPMSKQATQPIAARLGPMSVPMSMAPQGVAPLSFLPQSSSLQFSQSRNGGYGDRPIAKKQRSNSGSAIAPPRIGQDFTCVGAPPIMTNMSSSHASNGNGAHNQASVLARAHPKATQPANQDGAICVRCHFPGADVRIRCSSGCAYHARCIDLTALCIDAVNIVDSCPTKTNKGGVTQRKAPQQACIRTCPSCSTPSQGMEILPLSFTEMDRVQESARAAFRNCDIIQKTSSPSGSAAGTKRSSHDMLNIRIPTSIPSHAGAQPRRTVQCYDPTQPRTGRWTDEEILFRDTLISHFLSGSLPLSNGLKLNDFLPVMLKSKQSRLAKKMKHAKLSTKYFYPKGGCASTVDSAQELSRLEKEFVASIPDAVERSEVLFHMGREWREHFANRCHSLRIPFDGTAWLSSVDDMERRLAFEKERHRLVKRRFMMGKAMEKDGNVLERGVFVNKGLDGREEFELVVEKSVSNSAGAACASQMMVGVGKDKAEASQKSAWSSNETNFKHAAPFLAGIASYIERNGVPFEHVDVWVPSYVENGSDPSGSSPTSPTSESNFRLCFGGSVTMGVQIVSNAGNQETSNNSSPNPSSSDPSSSGAGATRRFPLISEEKTNFSLFGDYSAKFSFSSGSGLPGRIFKSGVPAWEQFVSGAHPSLFERRGGAMQFGIKTALGIPVDSPNVGRVVLVLYSKYDRCRDEKLVARMMCDLKLLNPSPRWKLVVDVDIPSASGVSGGVGMSSLQAPPPTVDARSSPALSHASTLSSRGISTRSIIESYPQASNVPTNPMATNTAAMSNNKESQIKSLIFLLASNIPSDMNSPLGQQLHSIMSLRLILLRGSLRTLEEEQLVDTVLVLYESYLHAGRSKQDIALMLTRDFTFHLGHLGGLGMQYGCSNLPAQGAPQGSLPPMYAVQAPAQQQMPQSIGPLMGSITGGTTMGSYNATQVYQHPRSPPMMGTNQVMTNCYAPQQQQQPRSQSLAYVRKNSNASSVCSLLSS